MDDAEGGSSTLPDAMSAEYAIGAVDISPAILQAADPPLQVAQSEEGCRRNQMLLTYAVICGTTMEADERTDAAAKDQEAAGSAVLLFSKSHDLWTYRKREGQPLDSLSLAKGLKLMSMGHDFLPCANADKLRHSLISLEVLACHGSGVLEQAFAMRGMN
jgi:hypothetical protein